MNNKYFSIKFCNKLQSLYGNVILLDFQVEVRVNWVKMTDRVKMVVAQIRPSIFFGVFFNRKQELLLTRVYPSLISSQNKAGIILDLQLVKEKQLTQLKSTKTLGKMRIQIEALCIQNLQHGCKQTQINNMNV
jgi:hypothetical protein